MDGMSPHAQLDRMITGYWLSQAIYAAAKFGIADLLSAGTRSVDALYRLLRALASVGILSEGPPRQFSLTLLAEPQADAAGDVGALRVSHANFVIVVRSTAADRGP